MRTRPPRTRPTSQGARLAFSADSYVVRPLFFPGGSIGDLAVNGTVNDVAWVDKLPGGAPPALKQLEGPILQADISGKKWFFLGLPDALPIQEFYGAVQS